MKTIISITPFSKESHAENIFLMILNHNSGKTTINTDLICSYLMAINASYPTIYKYEFSTQDGKTIVTNGGKPYLTFEEKEFVELVDLPEMWEPENNGQLTKEKIFLPMTDN